MPTSKYLNEKGQRLPSVTQILDHCWPKPGLIEWANREGLAGRSHTVVRDRMAKIGTLAHELVFAELGGPAVPSLDESEYPQDIQQAAKVPLYHARNWFEGKEWEPILVEQPLIARVGFGGTPDWYGMLNGKLTVLDLKTGRNFAEHGVQLAGYIELLKANDYDVEEAVALYAPRTLTGKANHTRWEEDSFPVIARAWAAVMELYAVRLIIG